MSFFEKVFFKPFSNQLYKTSLRTQPKLLPVLAAANIQPFFIFSQPFYPLFFKSFFFGILCVDFEFLTPKYLGYFIEYFIIFLEINPIVLLKHGQETGLFKPLLMTYCKKNDSF